MSPSMPLSVPLQALLDEAVFKGSAPGLAAIAFDRNGTIASAHAGVRSTKTNEPMTLDTVCWTASMSKVVVSVAVLALIESMSTPFDLDSNDALAEILPELKLGSGGRMDQIFDGKDEGGEWRFKRATVGVSLRDLMLHTSGLGYYFTSEETASMCPDYLKPELAGSMDVAGADWLGQFVERVSGKTLRSALQTLVFDRLHLPPDTIDTFITPNMKVNLSAIHTPTSGAFIPIPVSTPQFEGVPPAGLTPLGGGPVWSSISSYAIILRSVLNATATPTGPIVSSGLWEQATSDGLKKSDLSLSLPVIKSCKAAISFDLPYESRSKSGGTGDQMGWTMLQTTFTRTESASGRRPGTMAWGGLTNCYYWVDSVSGVGGVLMAQFLPFAEPAMLELRDAFECLVYSKSSS